MNLVFKEGTESMINLVIFDNLRKGYQRSITEQISADALDFGIDRLFEHPKNQSPGSISRKNRLKNQTIGKNRFSLQQPELLPESYRQSTTDNRNHSGAIFEPRHKGNFYPVQDIFL